MRKIWLIFAQAATAAMAVFWVWHWVFPGMVSQNSQVVTIEESGSGTPAAPAGSLRDAARRAMPSVVNIYTSKKRHPARRPLLDDPLFRHFFGDQQDDDQPVASLGSGVIVSDKGYILTNHHVVEQADQIEVALHDGRTASAHVVGSDPETDLAVLKIDLDKLPAITFGRSDQIHVGDPVLAIGDPFGVGLTVTHGIVSALDRSQLGINTFENFIQTDAPINPGNSGGALVDATGALIGINTAIYSRSGGSMGIGFAIPVNLARKVMDAIIQHGQVTRGWMGVEVQDLTHELADPLAIPAGKGALVAGVLRSGPADNAGIRPGDVVRQINSKAVNNATDLLNIVSALKPGESASIHLVRNGKNLTVKALIGKRPHVKQN